MCVTAFPAHLDNTILYCGECSIGGQYHHLAGYQNWPLNRFSGPNFMILPVPAVPGTMTEANFYDPTHLPYVLKDMAAAVRPPQVLSYSGSRGLVAKGFSPVEVFNVGLYTMVLAHKLEEDAIRDALSTVPVEKRPDVGRAWDLMAEYAELYPVLYDRSEPVNSPLLLPCFNNRQAEESGPLLYSYQPIYRDVFFFPALDAHDGTAPKWGTPVSVDHTIVFGVAPGEGAPVRYRDNVPADMRKLLPAEVVGVTLSANDGPLPNGDFYVEKETGGHTLLRSGSDRRWQLAA